MSIVLKAASLEGSNVTLGVGMLVGRLVCMEKGPPVVDEAITTAA